MTRMLVNIIGFNAGWFACVLGAASGHHWIGPAAVAILLLIHLRLNRPRRAEAALAAIAGAAGFVVDTLLIATGVFDPVRFILPAPLSTFWLVTMWINFGMLLNVSLKRLQGMPLVAAALGLLGGPSAYYGGYKLGAVTFDEPLWIRLAVLAAAWAAVTPLLLLIARFLRERAEARA
jgi:hypothetical protein